MILIVLVFASNFVFTLLLAFVLAPVLASLAKTRFKDVRANCFCASLLRTKFTRHVMHRAHALSSKVNNNRTNDHCDNFEWI